MTFIWGTLIGLGAGIASGMLGIGGGIIQVPGMVLLLGVDQHTAQGVSLAVMIVTAAVGAIVQYRQGNVKPWIALWVAPSAAVFAFVGASLANLVEAGWLSRIFGLLILFFGTRMILSKPKREKQPH